MIKKWPTTFITGDIKDATSIVISLSPLGKYCLVMILMSLFWLCIIPRLIKNMEAMATYT